MILKLFDIARIPVYLDTTMILSVYASQNSNAETWRICMAMRGDHTMNIWRNCSMVINGVEIVHDGTAESCTKIIDIIGEIMYLEREEPKVDMDRFAKLGKTDKKKSK